MVADSAEVAEGSPWYPTKMAAWLVAIASSVSQEAFPAKGKAALDAAFPGLEVSGEIYYPLLSEYQVQH
jgi:hypothetical protein